MSETATEPVRLLSVSGGGWNSFSNLAGVFAGSLDRLEQAGSERSLSTLLDGYDYISGNSGGTWFLTALGFSNEFRNGLVDSDLANNYNSSGYNAQIRKAFNDNISYKALKPLSNNPFLATEAILTAFKNNWGDLVKKLVYDTIPVMDGDIPLANKTFSSDFLADPLKLNLTGRKNKHLTYSSAVTKGSSLDKNGVKSESNAPIIAEVAWDKTKVFAGYNHGPRASSELPITNFYPLSIEIRKDGHSQYRIANAFSLDPERSSGKQSPLGIQYDHNGFNSTREVVQTFPSEGNATGLGAIDPSIASSAAAAASAFPIESTNQLAYKLASNAPMATFQNGLLIGNEFKENWKKFKKNWDDIIHKGYLRTADGGYLDNTSLAYNLSAATRQRVPDRDYRISARNKKTAFEATLFQNSSETDATLVNIEGANGTEALIPEDLAALFGLDNYKKSKYSNRVQQNRESELWTLSPQIFKSENLTNADLTPKWDYRRPHFKNQKSGSVHLQYFELDVETKTNATYGTLGNVNGKLKIYLSVNPDSNAMPYKESIHDEYEENYNTWKDAITTAGAASIPFLSSREPIHGSNSNNSLIGDNSHEMLLGYKGRDNINGGIGNDMLLGGNGNDTLTGGKGDDVLIGGSGSDILTGGTGSDTFTYQHEKESRRKASRSDTITDFQSTKGDKINLSEIHDDLNFNGSSDLNNPGDIRFENSTLYVNTDKDNNHEIAIKLQGVSEISTSDLIL